MNKSLAVIIPLVMCAAFGLGYLYRGTEEQPLVSESSAESFNPESRIGELLIVFPYSMDLPCDPTKFIVMNAGTRNVTLSEIRINGIANSSSPGWRIEYGDGTIQAGEMVLIGVDATKYYIGGITSVPQFSFTTSRGNVYYCIPAWPEPSGGEITRVEKIEILNSVAIKDGANQQWSILIDLKNSGSADATVQSVRINGKSLGPDSYYNGTDGLPTGGLRILAGQEESLIITLSYYDTTNAPNNPVSGADIEVKLHTAAGMDYPDWVTLP